MRCTQGDVHGKLSMDGDIEGISPQRDPTIIFGAIYLEIATPHTRSGLGNTIKTMEYFSNGRPHMV